MRLPPGSRRLPPNPVPRSVDPSALWGVVSDGVDVHELFRLPEPMAPAAAFLSAHVPPGMSLSIRALGTGRQGPIGAETAYTDLAYKPRSVPAGVNAAQLVLTIAPNPSGGSLLRVDAQVLWYPARTAAEYIDAATYHVLRIDVTIFGARPHTIHRVVTSSALIMQLAKVLNRLHAAPYTLLPSCPPIDVIFRLAFAVSRQSAPAVVVTANRCLWIQVTAGARTQPRLQDSAPVLAVTAPMFGLNPQA
ncbi:MAG TPA: hypothetical protein VLM11_01215 [Streptosporangiaceae bacterium]|nr:hypothetical protein [Streptosporangiaceae bacterium]